MASPVAAEEHSNTKTEEGTTTFHKKRSRRVSFAENTSVHIFDRDEEYETAPDPEPLNSPYEDLGFSRGSDSKQFFGNEEEDDVDDDMDEFCPRSPFLQVVRSPSSGGSTIGSATSNDEDNFFGPVSTNFIRRDLSDSAASDENHDLTMDSTAFSMHFHSIARSDSEADLKTSMGIHLSFEEKTPASSSVPSNTSSMPLTLAKKSKYKPDVSTSKLSTGPQSNDMSLVGKYHDKYDYGKLSPAIDPLLAEGHNDLHAVSHMYVLNSLVKAGKEILANKENGCDLMDSSYSQDNKLQDIYNHEELSEVISVKHNEIGMANDGSKPFSPEQIAFGVSSNKSDTQASKPLSPYQSNRGFNSSLEFLATSHGSPSNPTNMVHQLDDIMEKENKSPLLRSATHFTNKPGHMLSNFVSLSKSPGTVTPSHDQAHVFSRTESQKHSGSVSSLQKSISKLRVLEASPFSAGLNAKLQDSNSRSLAGLSKMTPLGTLEKNNRSPQANCMNNTGTKTPDTYLEVPLPFSAQKKREKVPTNMNAIKTQIPSENSWSGEHLHPNILKSADTRYSFKDDENKIGLPQAFNCSPLKAITAEFRVSPYRDEKQPIQQNELVTFGPGHVGGLGESITNTRVSAVASDGINSLYIERRENSTPLNVAGSNLEVMHDRKTFLNDACSSETRGNLTAISNDKKHENFQSKFEGDLPMGQMKASLLLNKRTDGHSCQKNLGCQFVGSPSNKELYSVLHYDSIDSLPAENVQSSGVNQLSNRDVSSAERKRKTEDVMTEKIARIRSSTSGLELSSDNGISSKIPNLKHLAEINTRFFKETKLLPQSVDKMNLHAVDRLVDILGQLQMSKTYHLLSDEILAQTILDPTSNIQHKRVADTKMLLCKIVHEQAKLQLMHLKRERLLQSVQSLASGIQESEALKLNYSPQNRLNVHQPLSDYTNEIQKCQADRDKVAPMRQALEDVNSRISNLTKSFHASCKMKGEPDPADTIAYVNGHLIKRAHLQILRKDLQLWVLDDLKSNKDHHDVVLNYLDLITQRLTLTTGVVPTISISNMLNEMNIHENFKDMNASTAFGFVFDAGLTQKHVGATSLAQETQMTSSLLGNLVTVMEEIQLARIELKNLIYARFHTSLDENLYLELCFFDSNSRKKATVTLHTSCLKRGIYPSEISPYQIDIPIDESQNSCSQSLSAEITTAVKGLSAGFSRILRLCRYISQLLSPSK